MSAKIAPNLPSDDRNGLDAIAQAFLTDPEGTHVVVALVDCKEVTTDVASGTETPKLRITAIEGFRRDSKVGTQLRRTWREQWESRTGNASLPIELGDAFDDRESP